MTKLPIVDAPTETRATVLARLRSYLPPRNHRAALSISSPDLQVVFDALDEASARPSNLLRNLVLDMLNKENT